MISFSAGEIAKAVSGELVQGNTEMAFASVSTDTRQINEGDLFFALVGEKFDAHDFIDKAIAGGAGGLVVNRRVDTGPWSGAVIVVADTLAALQELARYNRQQFTGLIIGVTGSNGKTTTKDLISSVLEQRFRTLKTKGNFNNHIGLPLTLLKLDNTFGAAVLEMGMRGLGEIDLLAGIAKPDGAVITNIGETHLERLGSVSNIARAKGEILDHMGPNGYAVLNGDDQYVRGQAGRCRGRVIYYGTGGDASLLAVNICSGKGGRSTAFDLKTPAGNVDIILPIPGRHNVLNAMAAAAVGLEAGLSLEEIKTGLENVTLTGMRVEIIEEKTLTIIDDTYNANPASVIAALRILADVDSGGRKVAILGDMYELGQRSAEGHREVGVEAAKLKIDILVTVGKLAEDIAIGATFAEQPLIEVISLNSIGEVKKYLPKVIRQGDVILVKGSRGMKLEEVVIHLREMVN